jgi:hypothetical protein
VAGAEAPDAYRYDPQDPTPAVGGVADGGARRQRVTLLDADKHERYVEELLQRSLDQRATDFGPPDILPLPTPA